MQEALRESFARRAARGGVPPERLTAEEAEAHGRRSALEFCRLNLGMKSVMFEPQSSSVHVLGRPVQVSFFPKLFMDA